jgi:hypothetical protein
MPLMNNTLFFLVLIFSMRSVWRDSRHSSIPEPRQMNSSATGNSSNSRFFSGGADCDRTGHCCRTSRAFMGVWGIVTKARFAARQSKYPWSFTLGCSKKLIYSLLSTISTLVLESVADDLIVDPVSCMACWSASTLLTESRRNQSGVVVPVCRQHAIEP